MELRKGYVDISMPNYLHKKLVEYSHKTPKRAQHCPYAPPPVRYGKESNLTIPEETSPSATEEEKKYSVTTLICTCGVPENPDTNLHGVPISGVN